MKRLVAVAVAAGCVFGFSAGLAKAADRDLAAEIKAAEKAFAKTMADRNIQAFAGHISDEGVFFGGKGPIRGREAIVTAWKRFFEEAAAPFSWDPETAEVLPSGNLGLTSGPVRDPQGELMGTFTTVWRLESDGKWRVIFDKGCDACKPEPEKAPAKIAEEKKG